LVRCLKTVHYLGGDILLPAVSYYAYTADPWWPSRVGEWGGDSHLTTAIPDPASMALALFYSPAKIFII
jgi:hypothetical protein